MRSVLSKLLAFIVMLAPLTVAAAETELAIPLAQPGDPLRAYLRISNTGAASAEVELLALTARDEVAARRMLSVATGETLSLAVSEVFTNLAGQIARIRAVHPPTITVQLAFGVRPPDRPKAFSVPVSGPARTLDPCQGRAMPGVIIFYPSFWVHREEAVSCRTNRPRPAA